MYNNIIFLWLQGKHSASPPPTIESALGGTIGEQADIGCSSCYPLQAIFTILLTTDVLEHNCVSSYSEYHLIRLPHNLFTTSSNLK